MTPTPHPADALPLPELPPIPELPTHARLYYTGVGARRYKRASVQDGPGEPLVMTSTAIEFMRRRDALIRDQIRAAHREGYDLATSKTAASVEAIPLPEPFMPLDHMPHLRAAWEAQIREAMRVGGVVARCERTVDVDDCKRLANVYANAWALVHNTPRDSNLLEGRQERLSDACKDLHAAIDALASQPAQEQPDTYVQPVPDKCDRIVWRGQFYNLPLEHQQAGAAEVSDDQINALLVEDCSNRKEMHDFARAILALKATAGGVA